MQAQQFSRTHLLLWSVLALVLFCSFLYLGIGIWSHFEVEAVVASLGSYAESESFLYDGQTFPNREALQAYILAADTDRAFPLIERMPPLVKLAVGSFSFAAIGGLTELLWSIRQSKRSYDWQPLLLFPLCSGLLSPILLAVQLVLPSVLTNGPNVTLNSSALFGLCIVTGLFSERVYDWLRKASDKVI